MLSTRERVLAYARQRILNGLPPTVREVQEALGLGHVKSAQEHLDRLVRDGLLRRLSGISRGLRLPPGREDSLPAVAVPILGSVQAGEFNFAAEKIEGYLPVQCRASPGQFFALRVRGESMTGAGLLPGDLVIVRRQPSAESGQVVVALVEDEATVKYLRVRGPRVELHPANPAFPVLTPDPARLRILGRVIESRRAYD